MLAACLRPTAIERTKRYGRTSGPLRWNYVPYTTILKMFVMLQREFVIKSSGPSALKVLLFLPAMLLAASLLFYMPWSSPNAPAWVKAVGSIVAIFAAWLIPHQLERARLRK